MRILVVYAHPVEESFVGGLHRTVVDTLTEAGHEVDDCDLYAEGFSPVLTRQERLDYHDVSLNRKNVEGYVERLLAAEAMVTVHPVWNFGYPAILKGYFDRVFLPGVSFDMVNDNVKPCLHNIRKYASVVTYGGSRFRAFIAGDPPRKLAKRVIRVTIKPGARLHYLAHYDMNHTRPETRAAFLEKVRRTMRTF